MLNQAQSIVCVVLDLNSRKMHGWKNSVWFLIFSTNSAINCLWWPLFFFCWVRVSRSGLSLSSTNLWLSALYSDDRKKCFADSCHFTFRIGYAVSPSFLSSLGPYLTVQIFTSSSVHVTDHTVYFWSCLANDWIIAVRMFLQVSLRTWRKKSTKCSNFLCSAAGETSMANHGRIQ